MDPNQNPSTPTPNNNGSKSGWKNKSISFDFSSLTPDQKKKYGLIGGGILLLVLLVIGVIYATNSTTKTKDDSKASTSTPQPTPTPAQMSSLLDGVLVSSEAAQRHPLGIMVENLSIIRGNQEGLSSASIVYEAITEGGITRFLAIFGHTLPEKVGPVRSARTVFIDYAEEYTPGSAYYAHVGGAADALGKIKGDKVYDLDNSGLPAFQRFAKSGLASEHTMYVYPEKLFTLAKEKGYNTAADFKPWKFKKDADAVSRPEAQSITIPFSSAAYEVKYTYDKATNTYKRYMQGAEHKDALANKQLSPKNVVVHFAGYETVKSGGKDVQKVSVIGEGTAKIFIDGRAIEAKWKKSSSPGRTIYTDAATGKEIEFNPGQIFVEIAKIGTTITVQ